MITSVEHFYRYL